MMMAIMTCVECGADLREWDFLKRRARLVQGVQLCRGIRTIPDFAPPGERELHKLEHLLLREEPNAEDTESRQ